MSRVRGGTLALCSLFLVAIAGCSDTTDLPPPSPCEGTTDTSVGTEQFGVPLTPAVYLINFLFLYMANPDDAANMPAYMAPLPPEFVTCLRENPTGCPWEEYERYFDLGDTGDSTRATSRCQCAWLPDCEIPDFRELSPRRYEFSSQINQPLGATRAAEIARVLGVDESMVLSDEEYQCVIGSEPRTPDQAIIFECVGDLTNSIGNADIPLSSYGLDITSDGLLRSNCAPNAPCLEFNALLAGPLEKLMAECGAEEKFARMVTRTPFLEFGELGGGCQDDSKPACIVDARCTRTPE